MVALAAVLLALGAADGGASPAAERKLTIFYTAEIHGTPEPSGCASDPQGDVARYAALARAAAKGGAVLVLDAGGLSYPEGAGKQVQPTDVMRARFVATELAKLGSAFAAGLAASDLRGGASGLTPLRL